MANQNYRAWTLGILWGRDRFGGAQGDNGGGAFRCPVEHRIMFIVGRLEIAPEFEGGLGTPAYRMPAGDSPTRVPKNDCS